MLCYGRTTRKPKRLPPVLSMRVMRPPPNDGGGRPLPLPLQGYGCLRRNGTEAATAGVPFLSLAPEDERSLAGWDSDLITVPRPWGGGEIVLGLWSRSEVNDVGLVERERA